MPTNRARAIAPNIITIFVGALLTIEELRVAFLFPSRAQRSGESLLFPVDPQQVLFYDILTGFFGLFVWLPFAPLSEGGWHIFIIYLIFALFLSLSVISRFSTLVLNCDGIVVKTLLGTRHFAFDRVGAVVQHSSDPDSRGSLWVVDRASEPLVKIEGYASLDILLRELSCRGVAINTWPSQTSRAAHGIRLALALLGSLMAIWASMLLGPSLHTMPMGK